MKSILLYCNWGVYVDENNKIHIPSVHYRYLKGLKNIGFDKIYLMSKVSSDKKDNMDCLCSLSNVNVISLPWFKSYQDAVKNIFSIVKKFNYVSTLNLNKVYIRTFEPFGWLLASVLNIKNSINRQDVVFHFISDPKSAIFSNASDSRIKKIIRYGVFLPELYLTALVARFFKVTSNGPVPIQNMPCFLTNKMHMVIESALLKNDININNNKFINDEKIKILYVGYLRASKGIDVLIDAILILNNKGFTNFEVTLVGEGDYRKQIEKKINSYELNHFFKMTGYIPFSKELFDYYLNSHVFVNVSPSETGPRVLLEAKVFNNYLISTDVGYANQIIDSEIYGKVVPVGDSQMIAEEIMNYISSKNKCNLNGYDSSKFNHSTSVEDFFKEVLNVS